MHEMTVRWLIANNDTALDPEQLLDLLVGRPGWHDDAACRGVGVDLFFPERGASLATAQRLCRSCPVAAECLAAAMADPDTSGVWGGTSENQRRRARSRAHTTGQPVEMPTPTTRIPDPIECGTRAGYRRHLRNGHPPCPACRAALAAFYRARRAAARAS